jgi:hypothetical protein
MPSNCLYHKVFGYGLGDQLLDTLGALVIMKHLRYEGLVLMWKTIIQNHPTHGDLVYDPLLFNIQIPSLRILQEDDNEHRAMKTTTDTIHFCNPSASSSAHYVAKFIGNVSVGDILNDYIAYANCLKPSGIIKPYLLPENVNIVGIHVRTSDKIQHYGDQIFSSIHDVDSKRRLLIDNVAQYLETHSGTKVYVCGERIEDAEQFINDLRARIDFDRIQPKEIPGDLKQTFKGIEAVRDMFCLSQCKQIHQLINYSTFSLLASFVGNTELVNYWLGNGQTLQYNWVQEVYPLTHSSKTWRDPELFRI